MNAIRHINPEILAQRLERAAEAYEQTAKVMALSKEGERFAVQLRLQAIESREWAETFRSVTSIGFTGDELEMTYDA